MVEWLTHQNAFFSYMHVSIYRRNGKTQEKCPSSKFALHYNVGASNSQLPTETFTQYGRLKFQV